MLGSIYAMVAVALTLSIGILRFLNFSIPGLFMLGAMTVWAMVHNAIPWPLAAGAALLIAAAASLVVELFTWRRMRMAEHFIPLVSSMAFLILFENLAVAYWGSELQTVPLLFGTSDGALELLEIDACGFDKMDRAILQTIVEKFSAANIEIPFPQRDVRLLENQTATPRAVS